jgi:hypothetical protein
LDSSFSDRDSHRSAPRIQSGNIKGFAWCIKVTVFQAITFESAAIGCMAALRKTTVAMYLIGSDDHIMFQTDLAHSFQFLGSENLANWIMRIAQQKTAGVLFDHFFHGIKINTIRTVWALD